MTRQKSKYETEGYFIVANGEKYIEMCKALVKSIRQVGDQREITIFSDDIESCKRILGNYSPVNFLYYDETKYVKPDTSKWERLGGIPKMLAPTVTPYDKTIFIDSDSFVLNSLDGIWSDSKYWKCGVSTSGEMPAPSSWHFGSIDEVSEKVGLGPLPRTFSTLVFINKKLVPDTFESDIFHYFNEYSKYGIKRIFSENSVPDEILYSIMIAKNKWSTVNTDSVLVISNNVNDSLSQFKQDGYKIVTIFHKDPSVFENFFP